MHAGGHLVEHRAVGADEELAGQHADIIEFGRDPFGQRGGFVGLGEDCRGRGDGGVAEDGVAVGVERWIVARDAAVEAAGDQDRELVVEGYERFEHRGAADRVPRGLRGVGRVDLDLALAVVAEAGGLQHGGGTDRRQASAQAVEAVDCGPGRWTAADALHEAFFADPLLRDAECARAWVDGDALGEPFHGLDRDVLELVGDDVAGVGEVGKDDAVVVVGARHRRGGLRGDALLVGREDVRVIAELGRGGGEHAAELPSAEDADGRSGGKRRHAIVFQAIVFRRGRWRRRRSAPHARL